MAGGIYQIKNTLTNKKYIGSSKNIKRRLYEHRLFLTNNTHVNIHLQRAWNKDGESNFTFDVIEYCEQSSLFEREQHHIDSHNKETLYNLGAVGGGDNISQHPEHEAIVLKLQMATKKKWDEMSEEEYERRRHIITGENNPNYGNRWTDVQKRRSSETRKKLFAENPAMAENLSDKMTKWWDDITPEQRKTISEQRVIRQTGENNSFYGRKHSDETKKLLSDIHKEKYKNLPFDDYVAKTKSNPIIIHGVTYANIHKAADIIGVKSATIRYRCKSPLPRWDDWSYI